VHIWRASPDGVCCQIEVELNVSDPLKAPSKGVKGGKGRIELWMELAVMTCTSMAWHGCRGQLGQ